MHLARVASDPWPRLEMYAVGLRPGDDATVDAKVPDLPGAMRTALAAGVDNRSEAMIGPGSPSTRPPRGPRLR